MRWVDVDDLRGTERGECHRPGPDRSATGAALEALQRVVAHPPVAVTSRSGAQPPQCPAPPVTEARFVLPAPVVAQPVVAPAVGCLRMRQERQVALRELGNGSRRVALAADDDQAARGVVDAVAEPPPGDGAAGVLEEARLVAEAEQMVEGDGPGAQATLVTRDSMTWAASARYCPATAGHPSWGESRAAPAAMEDFSSGSVSTCSSAAAIA